MGGGVNDAFRYFDLTLACFRALAMAGVEGQQRRQRTPTFCRELDAALLRSSLVLTLSVLCRIARVEAGSSRGDRLEGHTSGTIVTQGVNNCQRDGQV